LKFTIGGLEGLQLAASFRFFYTNNKSDVVLFETADHLSFPKRNLNKIPNQELHGQVDAGGEKI
jgi:hypothetical protein